MNVNDLLQEWEKDNNPFYPYEKRYTRTDLLKFAEWCVEKFGHSSNSNNNQFVIPDVSVSLHEEKPIGSCMKDGCYKPQRNCGLCEEHYKEFGENLRQ